MAPACASLRISSSSAAIRWPESAEYGARRRASACARVVALSAERPSRPAYRAARKIRVGSSTYDEVATPQVLGDPRGQHARQRPRRLVSLRARRGHVDPSERRRLDRRRQKAAVLDDRAAERFSEPARQRGAVALDDDIEIATTEHGAAPQIADEPTDEIRATVLLLGESSDRLEQLAHRGRQTAADAPGRRGLGETEAHESSTDGTDEASSPAHHHERRSGRELTTNLHFTRARLDDRQRARDLRRAKCAQAERARPDEVVAQHVGRAGGDQAGVALAREPERLGHAESGRRRRDRDVGEIARREADLRIDVRPLGHDHARGWNRRYICRSVADGKCV